MSALALGCIAPPCPTASDSKSLGARGKFDARIRIGDGFRPVFSTGRTVFGWICSCEHEKTTEATFQQPKTQTLPSAAPVGAKSMAQTINHLRDLLEKIKGDAEGALARAISRARLIETFPDEKRETNGSHCPKF